MRKKKGCRRAGCNPPHRVRDFFASPDISTSKGFGALGDAMDHVAKRISAAD